jgi:hypothetical protein
VEGESVKAELGAITAIVGAVPVVDVARKGMIDAPEMATDLMTAPGSRSRLDKREPHIGHEECLVFRYGLHVGTTFSFGHRGVDDTVLWWRAADEREVRLVDGTGAERILERTGMLRRKGEHEHATGRTVKAMHRIHPLTDRIARKIERKGRALVVTAMNRQTRGLVDDNDGVITIEHVDG